MLCEWEELMDSRPHVSLWNSEEHQWKIGHWYYGSWKTTAIMQVKISTLFPPMLQFWFPLQGERVTHTLLKRTLTAQTQTFAFPPSNSELLFTPLWARALWGVMWLPVSRQKEGEPQLPQLWPGFNRSCKCVFFISFAPNWKFIPFVNYRKYHENMNSKVKKNLQNNNKEIENWVSLHTCVNPQSCCAPSFLLLFHHFLWHGHLKTCFLEQSTCSRTTQHTSHKTLHRAL